jgi:hypothetical protein
MPATKTKTARKHTKFAYCDKHAPWFNGETRYRIAETFVEGGPGGMQGCSGGTCRLWPGTDFYVESICHEEMTLDWTEA